MLEKLSPADFETLPDARLAVVLADGELALDVVEVTALGPSRLRAEPFSLVLRHAGASGHLPQGTYRYRHPVHGDIDLFTVPIGPDGLGMCYQIIFA